MGLRGKGRTTLSLPSPATKALAHIHSLSILHRDVKPGNVLLFFDGTNLPGAFVQATARLADFGCARLAPCFSAGADTQMSAQMVTANYRAPELIAVTMTPELVNAHSRASTTWYGAGVDVWAYGATVYEMLLGGPLVNAWNTGAQVMSCLIRSLGHPMPLGIDCPAYMAGDEWKGLVAAAKNSVPHEDEAWPQGLGGRVCRECLKWAPTDRTSMASLCKNPWFQDKKGTLPEDSPTMSSAGGEAGESSRGSLSEVPLSNAALDVPRTVLPPSPRLAGLEEGGSSKQGLLLEIGIPLPGPRLVMSKEVCACRGHCRLFKHRKQQGCDTFMLVENTRYCAQCICGVFRCGRPCNNSPWCKRCRRLVADLPKPQRMAVEAAPLAPWLVPVDIEDFVS